MPDPTLVLASTEEREKWRHRLTLLQTTLRETRSRRIRLERRLAALRREIARITEVTRPRRPGGTPYAHQEVSGDPRPPIH